MLIQTKTDQGPQLAIHLGTNLKNKHAGINQAWMEKRMIDKSKRSIKDQSKDGESWGRRVRKSLPYMVGKYLRRGGVGDISLPRK